MLAYDFNANDLNIHVKIICIIRKQILFPKNPALIDKNIYIPTTAKTKTSK